MTADHKAFTIVTAFLGTVMLGFFVAHACALYHPDEPSVIPKYRLEALPA